MRKYFDIEKAKNGAPVRTRDGRKARIICWDYKNLSPECKIIALVSDGKNETACCYNEDGEFAGRRTESEFDLTTQIHREGWVLIQEEEELLTGIGYAHDVTTYHLIYNSKEEAEKDAIGEGIECCAIAKIEWEE